MSEEQELERIRHEETKYLLKNQEILPNKVITVNLSVLKMKAGTKT